MCTTIGSTTLIKGSGKGPRGWFTFDRVWMSYDHPFHVQAEHAVSIDFVTGVSTDGARVAVELGRESARELALRLLEIVGEADAYEA
jgi:hypothetical protein